uniref:Uncharacterized protein n=1 Tax=Anguilla anguilla TaxID=7936 RepID=A0A0E9T861_ANGAN
MLDMKKRRTENITLCLLCRFNSKY